MAILAISFWYKTNPLCDAADALNKLIPGEGQVESPRKNRALEKFRKAQNAYYDLYNNGLCNRAHDFRMVFGLASSKYRIVTGYHRYTLAESIYRDVEPLMERIVVQACTEQGIAIDCTQK